MKRGKHAKIRKMKEKYADQDEDDRQMRMALTGSKQVKGFDMQKHQKHKHGNLLNSEAQKDQDDQVDDEEEEVVEEAQGAKEELDSEQKKNVQDA